MRWRSGRPTSISAHTVEWGSAVVCLGFLAPPVYTAAAWRDVEEHGAEEAGPELPPEEEKEAAGVLVAGPGRPRRAECGAAAGVPTPFKQGGVCRRSASVYRGFLGQRFVCMTSETAWAEQVLDVGE